MNQNHRDVVIASSFVGGIHQSLALRLQITGFSKSGSNLLRAYTISQSITAEQIEIPRPQSLLLYLDFQPVAGADGAGDDMFQAMILSFICSNDATA